MMGDSKAVEELLPNPVDRSDSSGVFGEFVDELCLLDCVGRQAVFSQALPAFFAHLDN